MNEAERSRLGQAWIEMGLAEHASVAAFARFVLDLMSLGAPPDLLLDAIRAMKDEVHHARTCFQIARRFTDRPVAPGPLDVSGASDHRQSAEAIVRAAIMEGCFEETISARCAEVAQGRTTDPVIAAALAVIVEDESRHADLSWRFVEWAIRRYPELRALAQACFAVGLAAPRPPVDDSHESTIMEENGHLLPRTRRQVEDATLRDLIGPRVDALFGQQSVTATEVTESLFAPLAVAPYAPGANDAEYSPGLAESARSPDASSG